MTWRGSPGSWFATNQESGEKLPVVLSCYMRGQPPRYHDPYVTVEDDFVTALREGRSIMALATLDDNRAYRETGSYFAIITISDVEVSERGLTFNMIAMDREDFR